MFYLLLFIKSFIAGLIILIPLGPVSVIVVKRTLSKGFYSGFISGLGAMTADLSYALVAGLGIVSIAKLIEKNHTLLSAFSAIFLLILGFYLFFSSRLIEEEKIEIKKFNRWHNDYLSTLVIAASNPANIIQFFFIFPWLGITAGDCNYLNLLIALSGIFFSAVLLWSALCFFVSHFKTKLNEKVLIWIDRILGGLLIIFALLILSNIKFGRHLFVWFYHFLR